MATAKKSTAAVKSAAKKATTTVKSAAKKAETAVKADVPDVSGVAQEVIAGKWNSGRERDDALRAAGHDPALVQQEVAKQQSQV
jgi:hypothetical protein